MTDQIRQGNRNPRNLYSGPNTADHFAVVVGDLDHAAEVSGWLVEAARAHIAAGHPMPEPPPRPATSDEVIEQATRMIASNQLRRYDEEFDASHLSVKDFLSSAREDARALADAGLLADPGRCAATSQEAIDRVACVLREADAFAVSDAPCYRVWARKLADAGLLADPEQCAEPEELGEEFAKFRDQLIPDPVPGLVAERDALQARIDAALAEISQWWGTARPGDRVLMAVNSILRGHTDPRHAPGPIGHPYRARGGCDGECPDDSQGPCEPAVTPPDPSGRIRDNGPVEPFTEEDQP